MAAYRRVVDGYLRDRVGRRPKRAAATAIGTTVADLVLAWLDHCRRYYAAANTRSSEYDNCRYAVRPLVAVCGEVCAVDLSADDFRAVREAMLSGHWSCPSAKRAIEPWPRTHVNAQCNRIKRALRWGVEHGLVPAEVSAVVGAVGPLKAGRTCAIESEPVEPVADAVVDATLPHLPPAVRAMVELQRISGMRSDNVCSMRPMDVDQGGDVWLYRPAAHKGSHRDKGLFVALGPRCQAILRPFLVDRPADLPCFSPEEVRRPAGLPRPRDRVPCLGIAQCHQTR